MSTPVREAIRLLKASGDYALDTDYGDAIRAVVDYAEARLEEKPCPSFTRIKGDPWHGCERDYGHAGRHKYTIRLYPGYPEYGIAPPSHEQALAAKEYLRKVGA